MTRIIPFLCHRQNYNLQNTDFDKFETPACTMPNLAEMLKVL